MTRDFAFLQQRTWSQPGSAFMRAFRKVYEAAARTSPGGGRWEQKELEKLSAGFRLLFLGCRALSESRTPRDLSGKSTGRETWVPSSPWSCVSPPPFSPQFPRLSRGCVWSIELRVVGRSHAQRRIRPSGHRTDPSPRTLPVSLGSAGRQPASPGASNFP